MRSQAQSSIMVRGKDKQGKHKHTHGHYGHHHKHHHKRGHDDGDEDNDHDQRHHGSSHKHHKAPENTKTSFPCHDNHRKCRGLFHKQNNIKMHDGSLMDTTWQPCRLEDVQNFILKWGARPEGAETQGGAGQPPQSRQADQPQEPHDAAPGPSSTQHPTTGAQPVPQEDADRSGGGNTMEPVPGPGAPPPSTQPMRPAHEWMPGDDDMVYDVPGSHHEGMGYSQGSTFPDEPYTGGFEGDQGEDMSFAAGPGGKQGGSWPGSTVGPLVKPPRPQWVAHRPENLYHGDETDGVMKSQPHHLLPPTWNRDRIDYSMDYSQS